MSRVNEAMHLPSDRGIVRPYRRTFPADASARQNMANLEEQRQAPGGEEAEAAIRDSGEAKVEQVESISFAAKARAIMLLSLLSWLIVAAVLARLLA